MRVAKLKDFRRHGPGRKPASWSKTRNCEGDVAMRRERHKLKVRLVEREMACDLLRSKS